jgi:hypothetical protein
VFGFLFFQREYGAALKAAEEEIEKKWAMKLQTEYLTPECKKFTEEFKTMPEEEKCGAIKAIEMW